MSQDFSQHAAPMTETDYTNFFRPKLLRLSGACLLFKKWSKQSGRFNFALVQGNDKISWICNSDMANEAFDRAAA